MGVLLRTLVGDGCGDDDDGGGVVPLSSVSHVVIDEVHERDLNTDFVLTLLRTVLAENRRLRVILMSATASADLFARYFRDSLSGVEPAVLTVPGRTYPVETRWLSDCERIASARVEGWTEGPAAPDPGGGPIAEEVECDGRNGNGNALSPRARERIDNSMICRLIGSIVRDQIDGGDLERSGGSGARHPRKDGAVLVFLPGKGEIEALARVLSDDPTLGDRGPCSVLKLHSTSPRREQQAAFRCAPGGTVKVVLSTNVAETSVTIPDVSAVIDTGRVKESRYNPSSRMRELVTVWTSRASAQQRAGRSGRTGPGTCYRLYTEEFFDGIMPERTSPEISRTPLDELVMQVCLLEEHRRGYSGGKAGHGRGGSADAGGPVGTNPVKFLLGAPEPPPTRSLLHSCKHLVEVGALSLVSKDPELLFRLTPLGYHLSHLPMDAKVGKVLIVGCILNCVQPALTIAAALSSTKPCFLQRVSADAARLQKRLAEEGFGGPNWRGGTVKGDLAGTIAAYDAWARRPNERERREFAFRNALDHAALNEMYGLRSQFREAMIDAGFLGGQSGQNAADDDALLTSCCLVAGLCNNAATLMRPRPGRGNLRGGRLITKDGDICQPSSNSFQAERVRNAAEIGKDAYAVFHTKHRTIGANSQGTGPGSASRIFLSEVNFVSRFALLLFGGELEVRDNALIVDGWLKFKVGENGKSNSVVLIQELRKELDNVMLRHILASEEDESLEEECRRVMDVVRKLLAEE